MIAFIAISVVAFFVLAAALLEVEMRRIDRSYRKWLSRSAGGTSNAGGRAAKSHAQCGRRIAMSAARPRFKTI